MVDIATSLMKLANAIIERGKLKPTQLISSFTVTVPASQTSITNSVAPTGLKVFYVSIKVRSMGTATYIAVGRAGALEERMTIVGELYEAEAPKGAYLDTKEIMVMSDTTDAVIEIGGVLIPNGDEI